MGFYHGEVDGKWGPESVSALKRFQTERGIVNEGKITALSLIGLGLGPNHKQRIMPVISADAKQPANDSGTNEDGTQESKSMLPKSAVTAN